jgi:hypothetical protein
MARPVARRIYGIHDMAVNSLDRALAQDFNPPHIGLQTSTPIAAATPRGFWVLTGSSAFNREVRFGHFCQMNGCHKLILCILDL